MESVLIATLAIIAVMIALFATKFLGNAFKIISKIVLVITIILAITTIFVYKDLTNLKTDIAEKESIFVLEENGTTYAAVGIKSTGKNTFDLDSFKYYTKNELTNLSIRIKDENFSNETGRVFIITPELINKSNEVELGINLDQNDIIEILKSDNAYRVLADKMKPDFNYSPKNLENAYGDESIIKGYLLAASIINYFAQRDIDLLENIKTQNLKVVPETITFKIVKWIPVPGK